ncbi:sialic acid-binding Ig-like lectin 12 isoform X2 [Rhineura floridana]|nr:sialic acid-binding Ig-like lectin 12 isoform X2 [Rhineura floridana]XP_061452065.1 sialic acid-binding Ig-like lectin 12 isoform X2 [Rhineura floridana]XP_061452066.1 sialic acid-binding Ig-like lectin 12 isoform X2 [Rhineura floridana]XP_061452067.1 sialic acid-binding Ig-like lectin 12 isoform X2 [Rhineura floridana]XP_061452068.1 sialic acid-binding Ig-like lectin 12 isoform X2 [Rhineura floridana]
MGLPWKENENMSFSTPTMMVLILAFVCKGTLSHNLGYRLTSPASVSVQRGLCVHIPCHFTYAAPHQTVSGTLYGYWFKNNKGSWYYFYPNNHYVQGLLVVTNDKRQPVERSAVGRFHLTGDPAESNCSFSINDAKFEDKGTYYFRIERGNLRYTFITNQAASASLHVVVTELTEKPKIWNTSELVVGKPVTVICQAPGSCSGTPPKISWRTESKSYKTSLLHHQHSSRSWAYESEITFLPSLADQGKALTCSVTYPAVGARAEESIHLRLDYQPQDIKTVVNIQRPGCPGSREEEEGLDPVVAWEGDTVRVICRAEGRPDPSMAWMKENEIVTKMNQGKAHTLLLPEIRLQDAGEYQCQARNRLGLTSKTIRVIVQFRKREKTRVRSLR